MKVSAEMLRDDFPSPKQPENYNKITTMIVNEIDTLNHVVGNFLDFAHPRELELNYQSIPEILELSKGSLPLYQFPDVSIETSVAKGLPERMMDKSMMVQVISNLLLNAMEASKQGDTVYLRCLPFEEGIIIEIEDSGQGFDEETRKQIFNPFFTTKPNGTGIFL
jgi:signal transduction histidine kinase